MSQLIIFLLGVAFGLVIMWVVMGKRRGGAGSGVINPEPRPLGTGQASPGAQGEFGKSDGDGAGERGACQ